MVELLYNGVLLDISYSAFRDIMVDVFALWKYINDEDEGLIHCFVDCLILGK